MQLRARSIESMGSLIKAVHEDRQFYAQVEDITKKLFFLLEQGFAEDDPQQHAVKDTLVNTAFYLKENFSAFAPKLMENLLKDAQIKISSTVEDATLPSNNDSKGVKTLEFKLRGMENAARFTLNTSDLEAKIYAFNHIKTIAEAMGTGFEPFVEQVLQVLIPHMDYHSKMLQKSALKTFQYLLVAKGEPGNQQLFLGQVYDHFAMKILKAKQTGNLKDMKMLFKELYHCMKVLSENEEQNNKLIFNTEAKLQTFCQMMQACLQTVDQKKDEQLAIIAEKERNDQIDDEDMEGEQYQLYKIASVATYVGECCNILMETYKANVFGLLNTCVRPYFEKTLSQYQLVCERESTDASFFFIQFI